jgi:peroxiredoxin
MFIVLPFESLWMSARAGDLRPGDAAPDFSLPTQDRTSHVRLSQFRGRPVVLVFGSYT